MSKFNLLFIFDCSFFIIKQKIDLSFLFNRKVVMEDCMPNIFKYCDAHTLLMFYHSSKRFIDIWRISFRIHFFDKVMYKHFSDIENYFIASSQKMLIFYDNNDGKVLPELSEVDLFYYKKYDPKNIRNKLDKKYLFYSYHYNIEHTADEYDEILRISKCYLTMSHIIDLSKIQLRFKSIKIFRKYDKNAIIDG